jgi:Flp pilus assembly protein protease CpaA
VAAHLPAIRDITHHTVPNWLFDECATVAHALESVASADLAAPTQ